MGRQPPTGQPVGPKKKEIDWDVLDQLLVYQCTSNEIAGHFNMHLHTLYDKIKEKYGMLWTEYCTLIQSSGLALLRSSQFQKAVNNQAKGNTQMLMFLGKQYLGQKEGAESQIKQTDLDKMDKFFDMMKEAQGESVVEESSDLNNAESNTSNE